MKYLHKGKTAINLIGYGIVQAGETITSDKKIHHPHFEEVKEIVRETEKKKNK